MPPLRLTMDALEVDGDEMLAGIGECLETVRAHLQQRIDRLVARDRDFAEDLQTAKMEMDRALKATEQMRRELLSEIVLLKRAVEGLRTETDQIRRGMYRK